MAFRDFSLIHNSSLACFLLAAFVQEYERRSAGARHPSFEKLLLVLPMAWHEPTRKAIARRPFATPLHAVIADAPEIVEGLAARVAAYVPISGQGLTLACATGLLGKLDAKSSMDAFTFPHRAWPRGSRPAQFPELQQATVDRLANWFQAESGAEIYLTLGLH
ncbi:three component ABC system middle component [Cupriavidus necator]